MTSQINPYSIDGTFPIANQDNPSQGFRDNFKNTQTNFFYAAAEISDLQSKAILTAALNGSTINNDMAGTQLRRPQLASWTESLIDLGAVTGAVSLDFNQANFQKMTTAGPISLNFINWPASTGAGALGYGLMRIWIVVTNVAHTLTLPPSVSIGDDDLAGYNPATRTITFDVPGNFVFDFSSVDGGQNYLVFDLTRNRIQFRDPTFYFNDAVSPTFLVGFNQQSIALALELVAGNDTFETHGSQSSYASIQEHGNNVGNGVYSRNPYYAQFNGNAHTPGYSIDSSRAYFDSYGNLVANTAAIIQPNDFIGYVAFNSVALNPYALAQSNVDLAINEFSTIRSYATAGTNDIITTVDGTNYFDASPGGNLVISTKSASSITNLGNLKPAVSLENDQSVHYYGNIILSHITANGNSVSSYVPLHSNSSGETGQVAWDQSYFYICTNGNTWQRISYTSSSW